MKVTTFLVQENCALSIAGLWRIDIQINQESKKTTQKDEIHLFFPKLYLQKVWKLSEKWENILQVQGTAKDPRELYF